MKTYEGKLEGSWIATIKLDGVQVVVSEGVALSRAGKPLYNIPKLKDGIYEVFDTDWNTTVSRVRTQSGDLIPKRMFYKLQPPDKRLVLGPVVAADVPSIYERIVKAGYEGLVLHGPNDQMLKVKPVETHDLKITGVIPGKGKHTGRMGAVMTSMGKIGTGFTDKEREQEWLIGTTIEVQSMGTTKNGKLRHPRFVRQRFDK